MPPTIHRTQSTQGFDHVRNGRQDVFTQLFGAIARPTRQRIRRIVVVLERHLQRQRQAVELLTNAVAGQGHIGLAWLVAGVAVLGLEVLGQVLQVITEVGFQLFDPRCIAGVAFATGGEHVGDFFIAMDVEEQIDAVLFHLLLYEKDFRADFLTGALPGAVKVLAIGVGAQVTVKGTVRVHVRHQVQVGAGQQFFQYRVVMFFQAFDHAFHEPLGHVLAWVLLRDDPDLALTFGATAFAKQLDIAALNAFAGGQQFGAGLGQRLLDQPVMATAAVGFEIGKPGVGGRSFQAETQAVAFEDRRYAEPVDVVVGRYRLITVPGFVVRGFAGVTQAKPMLLADMQATGLEVKPLEMLAAGVWLDRQKGLKRVADVQHFNVAAVEIGADVERGFSHGHSRFLIMIYGSYFTRKRGRNRGKLRGAMRGASSLTPK